MSVNLRKQCRQALHVYISSVSISQMTAFMKISNLSKAFPVAVLGDFEIVSVTDLTVGAAKLFLQLDNRIGHACPHRPLSTWDYVRAPDHARLQNYCLLHLLKNTSKFSRNNMLQHRNQLEKIPE